MKSAQDIANYFLSHSYNGEMDDISNLKLQKLLYYAQGYALVLLNRPLFDDPIICWEHGPVVKSVWQKYTSHGRMPLPPLQSYSLASYDSDEIAVLNRVANEYGQYSAWKLRDMTHTEQPWLCTQRNAHIETYVIKNYFMEKLNTCPPVTIDFDVAEMQASIDSERITVPDLTSPKDFVKWLNR